MPAELSIIVGCYGQPKMMCKQLETWLTYPEELREKVEFIVVDDHGTPPFEVPPAYQIEVQVYRATKDIPWNQGGMRNLGMKQASATWRLMLDADMVLPVSSLSVIMGRISGLRQGTHYKLWLKHEGNSKPLDFSSPNLYIVHEHDFWAAGGYNEDFCGHKGFSDVVLHRTLIALGRRTFWNDVWADFYNAGQIGDAAVTWLDRDYVHNGKIFTAAQKFASQFSWKQYARGIVSHVRFEWHRVS